MKFIELFAGIGGFRAGLEPLGHECVGWVEWDKYARKSYEAIWPSAKEEWTAHDITTVTDDALRQFAGSVGGIDLIAGGFPCQAFSVAGKRGGFEDTRGTLFFEVARFASVLRPKYLLLENVVGLLNHDGGATFHIILCAMDELGYDAEWQVLNATDFGIPQNRERVFIVGHLRGRGGRKVFPIDSTDSATDRSIVVVGRVDLQGDDYIKRVYDPNGLAPTIPTMQGGHQEPKIIQRNQRGEVVTKDVSGAVSTFMSSGQAPKILQRPRGNNAGGLHEDAPTVTSNSYQDNNLVVESGLIHSRGFETRKDGISHCIKGAMGGSSKNFIKVSAVLTPDREEKRQNGRRFKAPDEPMFTLTAQDKHGVMVIQKTHGATTTVNYEQTGTLQAARLDKVPCVRVVGNTNPSGNGMNGNVFDADGLAPTLTTNKGEGNKILTGARIRKLTPLECWRLMGRTDDEFDKAKCAGVSDSQLYKQAGNSLVPQIVTEIGKRMGV